jgi:hypothetical protein
MPWRLGQAAMEIFNCTNYQIKTEKDSLIGIVEQISDVDEVGELNSNEMTVNIHKQLLLPAKPLTKEKRHYILEDAMLNVPDMFKKKYLGLMLKDHEVISDNKYNLGKCSTAMHDIELKNKTLIYVKQFKIHKSSQTMYGRAFEAGRGQALWQQVQQSYVHSGQEGRISLNRSRFSCNQSALPGPQLVLITEAYLADAQNPKEKEFCDEVTAKLYKEMKLTPEAGAQFSPSIFKKILQIEKYQTLQTTCQVAWQNIAQQQMNFKIYEY